jgi:hypothetical protein
MALSTSFIIRYVRQPSNIQHPRKNRLPPNSSALLARFQRNSALKYVVPRPHLLGHLLRVQQRTQGHTAASAYLSPRAAPQLGQLLGHKAPHARIRTLPNRVSLRTVFLKKSEPRTAEGRKRELQ